MEAALVFAAADGDASTVAMLLSQGARVAFNIRVFYLQKRSMSGKSFQEMLDTVLVVMASMGDARKVAELLSQGGRVDAREQGFTPLLAAAQEGHTEVCKLLLKTGKANVKETNPFSFTPFLVAAQEGHTEVCKLL